MVYLIAGTKRTNVAIFGKHHRVLVSPDGRTAGWFSRAYVDVDFVAGRVSAHEDACNLPTDCMN